MQFDQQKKMVTKRPDLHAVSPGVGQNLRLDEAQEIHQWSDQIRFTFEQTPQA